MALLAEDPRLIYSTYVIAFIPLTFIYALDFINDKWRPIRDTGRNGVIQLLASLPSVGWVIGYIVLQIKNNDHKEAATAITVACFNIYHVARTIWGLIQLYEFRNWNVYALRSLLQLGYSAPAYDYSDDVKSLISRVRHWFLRAPLPSLSSSSESSSSSSSSSSHFLPVPLPSQAHMTALLKSCKSKCKLLYAWIIGTMERKNYDLVDLRDMSLDDVKRTVDYHMVVNSSLIDNEFTSAELPLRLAVFSRESSEKPDRHNAIARLVATCLKSPKPEESAVRWMVSFLAKFGHEWLENTRGLPLNDDGATTDIGKAKLDASQYLAVLASLLTTYGSVDDTGSTEQFVSLLSPLSTYCTAPYRCRASWVEIVERCKLPFKMKGFKSPYPSLRNPRLDFNNHQATIRDAAQDDWHKASLNELDDANRKAVANITAVQLAMFSTLMEEDLKLSAEENWAPVTIDGDATWVDWKKEDPRVENLLYQLGYDDTMNYADFFNAIPIRKEFLGTFLWKTNPNRLVFQTSIHVDNFLALDFGDSLSSHLQEHDVSVSPLSPATMRSVFQDQYNLEISRLRSNILRPHDPSSGINCDSSRFLGCVFETVRTTLAEWFERSTNGDPEGWKSSIAPVGVRFSCSKQLCSAFDEGREEAADDGPMRNQHTTRRNLYMRILWEVQAYLHWKLGKDVSHQNRDIRESLFLIMLAILGFPSLKIVEYHDERSMATPIDGEHAISFQEQFSVEPIGGPQEVRIVVRFDAYAKAVSIELEPGVNFFDWQDWKDAFMGRISAQRHWRQTRLLSKREHLRDEAFDSRISSPVRVASMKSLGTDFDFTYWSGWPPWMVQIAHFEMKKLCQFFSRKKEYLEYWQAVSGYYMQCISDLNAAMDINFLPKMTTKKLYEDGHYAFSVGREEEAMKTFARCIAEHGHQEALKDAVNVVLNKNPVSEAQAVALLFQMDIWFNALLRGRPTEEQVDFEMLAHYFGVLYESTGESNAMLQKALALFHKGAIDKPVADEAIEAMESHLICEPDSSYDINFKFRLAIAHQSIFQMSGDPFHQEKAAKYIRAIGMSMDAVREPFGMSIGYLLEKGFFAGREAKRKTSVMSFFWDNDAWEFSGRIPEMFDRLFVERSVCRIDSKEGDIQKDCRSYRLGIGKRSLDAVAVYKHITVAGESNNPVFFSQALNRLGMLFHKGAEGISSNSTEAERRYTEAIKLSNADALCNMGVLTYGDKADGIDVSYFQSSVEGNCSNAMNNLGIAYEVGRGVHRNVLEAEKLYKQAISSDENPVARYNLAILYISGDELLQNRADESEVSRLLDELTSSETEFAPLDALTGQLMKLCGRDKLQLGMTPSWSVGLEEVDDCFAYVKILEGGVRDIGFQEAQVPSSVND